MSTKEDLKVKESNSFESAEAVDSPDTDSPSKADLVELEKESAEHRWRYHWPMIIGVLFLHYQAFVGFYYGITVAKIQTMVWGFILVQFGATGIICGAHRLWTHRSYKANAVFRTFLMLCNTLALQRSIYQWCLWHRIHHKYSDTDADPHNAKRGFFFSQIGWILVHPHPAYKAKTKVIDMKDLKEDAVVMFQHNNYPLLLLFVYFLFPVMVPVYFWGEALYVSIAFNFFRHCLSLHQTSLVNSAAHLFGDKIYDKRIMSRKHTFTTAVTLGEAYHNYHHAFPWDYSASEFGWDINYNPMTAIIDTAASFGMAWDRKKVTPRMVEERIRKYGDVDRLETTKRVPANVVVDTAQGLILLFWALWVILSVRFIFPLLPWDLHWSHLDRLAIDPVQYIHESLIYIQKAF